MWARRRTRDPVTRRSPAAGSPWAVVRRGLRLLPPESRRRIIVAVAASAVLAVVEAAAFALLLFLIRLLTDASAGPPAFASAFGAHDRGSFIARAGVLAVALLIARG